MSENYFEELEYAVRMLALPAMPEDEWVLRAARGGANVECERVQGPLGVDFTNYDFNATVRLDRLAYDNAKATAIELLTGWLLLGLAKEFVPNAKSLFDKVSAALLPATMPPETITAACESAMSFYCLALSEPQGDNRLEARFDRAMAINRSFFWAAVDWAVDELMGQALDEVVERWPL